MSTNGNSGVFQSPGSKHAHQRYLWYEQIIADGLEQFIGTVHVIAQHGWRIGFGRLGETLHIDPKTAERRVRKLIDRGHLRVVSGKAGRVVNEYEMVLSNQGVHALVEEVQPGHPRPSKQGTGAPSTRASTPRLTRASTPYDSPEESQDPPLPPPEEEEDARARSARGAFDDIRTPFQIPEKILDEFVRLVGRDEVVRVVQQAKTKKYVITCFETAKQKAIPNGYAGHEEEPPKRYPVDFLCSECGTYLGSAEAVEGIGTPIGYLPSEECGHQHGGDDCNVIRWTGKPLPPWVFDGDPRVLGDDGDVPF